MLAIRVHLFFSYFISFGCVKLLIKIIALDPRMHLLYKYAIVAKAVYQPLACGSGLDQYDTTS